MRRLARVHLVLHYPEGEARRYTKISSSLGSARRLQSACAALAQLERRPRISWHLRLKGTLWLKGTMRHAVSCAPASGASFSPCRMASINLRALSSTRPGTKPSRMALTRLFGVTKRTWP